MVSATPPMLTVALLAWLLPSSGHPASGLTFAPEHPRETLRVWFLRVLEAGAGFFLWGSSPHSGCGTLLFGSWLFILCRITMPGVLYLTFWVAIHATPLAVDR